jgi:hypothetical protein
MASPEASSAVSRVTLVGMGLVGWRNGWESVAAHHFREVDGVPAVGREVEELDLAEKGDGHGLEREAPGAWIGAEFEAREEQAEPVFGSGPSKSGEILHAMGCRARWNLDAGQAALRAGRHELAELAGDGDFRAGRLPRSAGREPGDGFLVGWDLGRGGEDGAGTEDGGELLAGGVMKDVRRVGSAVGVAGRRDRQDVDVEFHGGVGAQRWRGWRDGGDADARGASVERAVSLEGG